MNVRILRRAEADLRRIKDYIEIDNPAAARAIIRRIRRRGIATDRPEMTKHEALARLRADTEAIQALGARSLYLFGSTARDEARPDSDVDLFVGDYDEEFTAIELVRLRDRVRALLGAEADVTTRDGLHPLLRDEVVASAERVF